MFARVGIDPITKPIKLGKSDKKGKKVDIDVDESDDDEDGRDGSSFSWSSLSHHRLTNIATTQPPRNWVRIN